MENFVFPDEIKTKLIKMSKLMNFFLPQKIWESAASCISEMKCAIILLKKPFLFAFITTT